MYFYLCDTFLKEKKYAGALTKIENRLIDLGINGKIEKMNILKSANEVINDAIQDGAETIVAVGDDQTFTRTLHIVARHKNITLGFIPIVSGNIAKILGIPAREQACDILSARIISRIDLGKINSHYFFSALEISENNNLTIECDGKYDVKPNSSRVNISIRNLGLIFASKNLAKTDVHNPGDALLDIVFAPNQKGKLFKMSKIRPSIFPVKKAAIKNMGEPISVKIDNEIVLKTPLNVSVAARKLKIIVGKERMF